MQSACEGPVAASQLISCAPAVQCSRRDYSQNASLLFQEKSGMPMSYNHDVTALATVCIPCICASVHTSLCDSPESFGPIIADDKWHNV